MKKRNAAGIACYLLGAALFLLSNSAVVSGSPISLPYLQRVLLCSAAVCAIAAAPFLYRSSTRAGAVIKFGVAAALICCIFAFDGFLPNYMA